MDRRTPYGEIWLMRILLDLNVVLDLVRRPWCDDSAAIWDANSQRQVDAYLSSASFPTLFYLVRKHGGRSLAQRAVTDCLNSLTIVPVNVSSLRLAAMGPGGDFQDNLQVASAVEAKLEAIVTRDPKGFAGSPLPVLTPTEFLAKLPKAP
jgi:predicted nucleic acid-binding protein